MDQPAATWVLLVASKTETDFASVVREAQALAFPAGRTLACASLDEASAAATEAGDTAAVLVLSALDEATRAAAAGAMDSTGLPRWAMVVCEAAARNDVEIDRVAPEDWNARMVAQVFRGAVIRLRLRRDNARARGDLLTIGTRVVHDLRSPLGGVLTSAEVLREVLANEVPTQLPLTDSIVASVEGQIRLIRQLSSVAKASAQTHAPEKFNMGEPFWSALQTVEKRARTKGVTIHPPADWPDVTASPSLTEIAWQHLLATAVAGSSSGAKITAAWEKTDGALRFLLRSEHTVPPGKREALFMPFHLLHQPNAPREWELSLVRRLVELQGGRCTYEAPPGGGSVFAFTLPVSLR